MSLPRELLDELLSRYMDGELSADELARVEQTLMTDADARMTLESLRASSSLVRRAVDASGKPQGDFAARVFAAASAEADLAELPANHPLMLAKSGLGSQRTGGRRVAFVGLLVLAASLMLVALFAWPFGEGEQVAEVDNAGTPDSSAITAATDGNRLAVDGQVGSEDGTRSDPAITDPVTPNPLVDDGPMTLADSRAANSDSAAEDLNGAGNSPTADTTPDSGSIVSAGSGNKMDPMVSGTGQLAPGMGQLRAVMVYEVSITERGRESNVLDRVFRNAGVRIGDEREVEEDLVGHLRASGLIGKPATELVADEEGEGKRCQVIFLEGSGLTLERAMMGLLASEGEVSKVGFNLMMNPPVIAAIDELRVADPLLVRNGDAEGELEQSAVASSLSPSGYGGAMDSGFTVGSQQFLAVNAEQAGMLSQFSAFGNDTKTDIKSHVLVIVRFE